MSFLVDMLLCIVIAFAFLLKYILLYHLCMTLPWLYNDLAIWKKSKRKNVSILTEKCVGCDENGGKIKNERFSQKNRWLILWNGRAVWRHGLGKNRLRYQQGRQREKESERERAAVDHAVHWLRWSFVMLRSSALAENQRLRRLKELLLATSKWQITMSANHGYAIGEEYYVIVFAVEKDDDTPAEQCISRKRNYDSIGKTRGCNLVSWEQMSPLLFMPTVENVRSEKAVHLPWLATRYLAWSHETRAANSWTASRPSLIR